MNKINAYTQASLTSSRTAANSIYCPPALQSALDLQSGVLHAEDKDYTTAYSYFFEAFENFCMQGDDQDGKALGALKYMLLCKIMLNLVSIVYLLLFAFFLDTKGNFLNAAGRRYLTVEQQACSQVRTASRSRKYACHCTRTPGAEPR